MCAHICGGCPSNFVMIVWCAHWFQAIHHRKYSEVATSDHDKNCSVRMIHELNTIRCTTFNISTKQHNCWFSHCCIYQSVVAFVNARESNLKIETQTELYRMMIMLKSIDFNWNFVKDLIAQENINIVFFVFFCHTSKATTKRI